MLSMLELELTIKFEKMETYSSILKESAIFAISKIFVKIQRDNYRGKSFFSILGQQNFEK